MREYSEQHRTLRGCGPVALSLVWFACIARFWWLTTAIDFRWPPEKDELLALAPGMVVLVVCMVLVRTELRIASLLISYIGAFQLLVVSAFPWPRAGLLITAMSGSVVAVGITVIMQTILGFSRWRIPTGRKPFLTLFGLIALLISSFSHGTDAFLASSALLCVGWVVQVGDINARLGAVAAIVATATFVSISDGCIEVFDLMKLGEAPTRRVAMGLASVGKGMLSGSPSILVVLGFALLCGKRVKASWSEKVALLLTVLASGVFAAKVLLP